MIEITAIVLGVAIGLMISEVFDPARVRRRRIRRKEKKAINKCK
jgi:hypothetical protein